MYGGKLYQSVGCDQPQGVVGTGEVHVFFQIRVCRLPLCRIDHPDAVDLFRASRVHGHAVGVEDQEHIGAREGGVVAEQIGQCRPRPREVFRGNVREKVPGENDVVSVDQQSDGALRIDRRRAVDRQSVWVAVRAA